MEESLEQLICTLQASPLCDDIVRRIGRILRKQNVELIPIFISRNYEPLLHLEHWTWQLFCDKSHPWTDQSVYVEFFHILALFNKNLIFNYDDIESNVKSVLLLPSTLDCVKSIFEQIEQSHDDNDMFISVVSRWFDNISYFLHDNPEFETSVVITEISYYIARHYIMTDEYKSYLAQLHHLPLSEQVFTAKRLFYVKTCSLCLGSYLFAKAQDFVYTAEELLRHFGIDYIQIVIRHSYTMESWSRDLLACIAYLINLFAACCWWGGVKGTQVRVVFTSETAVCEHIDALIRIIDYKPVHQYILASPTNDETILIDTILFSMINIAQNERFTWFLRSKKSLPDTLLTLAKVSACDKIQLSVYGILAEIICDQRLKEMKISDSASVLFFHILEQAWQHPSKKFKQIPMYFLLKSFLNLSKIDAIQQQTVDKNKLPLLIEMCDQYPIVYDILWALSFNHDIREQIRSNASFMIKLAHLPDNCDNQKTRKIICGILWNLETNHHEHAITNINDQYYFEIMVSYSHKDEAICKRIYDELINAGYRVWIDFDQIHGNVMDAMATAIERSRTVLICMSEQYRRSNYCRAEANYAFQRRIRIVPILIQEHYQPDGWLLFLVSQLLYVDFTKYEFSQAMEMLIKELKSSDIEEGYTVNMDTKEYGDASASSTSLPKQSSSSSSITTILPENMLDWTEVHVQDWLSGNSLSQMACLFANFNGRTLMLMRETIEKLELEQVISLLHNDCLRRTNQSLSLIEFVHLRSLFDQYKKS